MDLDLSGKVALVTGGASGIGAACVRELSALGASVVVADLAGEAASAVAHEIGRGSLAVGVDVTIPSSVAAMVRTTVENFGGLDIAVNSAGVGMPVRALIADTAEQEWRRVLSINLDGAFYCMREEIPAMAPTGGCVVNIASVLGSVAAAGAGAYVSSKHGLVGLSKTAALDYATDGVRVNVVGPGFIDTPLLAGRDAAYLEAMAASHPLGRLGTAEEVSAVVAFLASPACSFVTGAYVPIDGGYLSR